MKNKFHVYKGTPWLSQLRDQNENIVALFPTMGGGYSTNKTPKQARRLAFKIAKLLNSK